MIHTVDSIPLSYQPCWRQARQSTAWTCGAPSAKANLPRARRSSTTPSRSARASGGATRSSSGARCCRSGSNSTTSQRILQRRRILLQDIRKRWWNCRSAPINWLPKPKVADMECPLVTQSGLSVSPRLGTACRQYRANPGLLDWRQGGNKLVVILHHEIDIGREFHRLREGFQV